MNNEIEKEVENARLSLENKELKESSVYNFSKLVYCFPLLGFLFICAKAGIPSNFVTSILAIALAPLFGFLFVLPTVLLSKMFGKHPKILAFLLYIIVAVIIIIAF